MSRVLCQCMNVTEAEIKRAIRSGADSVLRWVIDDRALLSLSDSLTPRERVAGCLTELMTLPVLGSPIELPTAE